MTMVAVKCEVCGAVTSIDPWYASGARCPKCRECCKVVGEYIESGKEKKRGSLEPSFTLPAPPPNSKRDCITVSVKVDGLNDIEKQLQRINKLVKETFAVR